MVNRTLLQSIKCGSFCVQCLGFCTCDQVLRHFDSIWREVFPLPGLAVKCSSALANVAKTDAKLCGHISWVQNKASTDHNLNFLFFTLI